MQHICQYDSGDRCERSDFRIIWQTPESSVLAAGRSFWVIFVVSLTEADILCVALSRQLTRSVCTSPGIAKPARPELTLMRVPSGSLGSGWLRIQPTTVLCKPFKLISYPQSLSIMSSIPLGWRELTYALHQVSIDCSANGTDGGAIPAFAITTSAVRPKVLFTSANRFSILFSDTTSAGTARIFVFP